MTMAVFLVTFHWLGIKIRELAELNCGNKMLLLSYQSRIQVMSGTAAVSPKNEIYLVFLTSEVTSFGFLE